MPATKFAHLRKKMRQTMRPRSTERKQSGPPRPTRSAASRSKLRSLGWLVGCAALASAAAHATPPRGWVPTWNDEFNGPELDATRWDAIHWTTPYNNERQAYLPEQVSVADGCLVLTAVDQPYADKPYRSGKVESTYAQRFGRWEVRAQLPSTQGTWPAIWLLPDTTRFPWPSQGEIDILENRGHQPQQVSSAYHFGANPGAHRYFAAEQRFAVNGRLSDFHEDFHVYAVEWDAQRLKFFVDDVHYHTVHNAAVDGFLATTTAPMETLLNVAVGGDFLGASQPGAESRWPQAMRVDYVRIFRRADDPPARALRNGGFEDQGGGLAGWTAFGSVVPENPNVQAARDVASAGSHALKLFGQFSGGPNVCGVAQGIDVRPGERVVSRARTFVRSADSIARTGNAARWKIEFYRQPDAARDGGDFLSETVGLLADGDVVEDRWIAHELAATTPADAVEARLSIVFEQPRNEAGAVHVDEVAFQCEAAE
jgi:beta-glucanase (GH16 family)